MQSTDVRNLIITLIILAAGVWLLAGIGKSYIPSNTGITIGTTFTGSLDALKTIIMIFSAFVVVLLIPIYLYKRNKEKYRKPPIEPYRYRK